MAHQRREQYAQQRAQVEVADELWRKEYHEQLKKKTAAFRRLQAAQEQERERREEELTKHCVRLRERQLATASAKLAAQGKNTAFKRQCKPIIPPPRKPPPVMYSTLRSRGAVQQQSVASSPRAVALSPMESSRQHSPTSTPHCGIASPDGNASTRSRQQHSPKSAARFHGVYHPELEPMRMPDFPTLTNDLFANHMADTQLPAKMSSSEEQEAGLLRRAQQYCAASPEAEAEKSKKRMTVRMMAARAHAIKQTMKDTAEQLHLQLWAEPGPAGGSPRFPTIAT